jgi:hypothetical protein
MPHQIASCYLAIITARHASEFNLLSPVPVEIASSSGLNSASTQTKSVSSPVVRISLRLALSERANDNYNSPSFSCNTASSRLPRLLSSGQPGVFAQAGYAPLAAIWAWFSQEVRAGTSDSLCGVVRLVPIEGAQTN